MKPFQTAGWMVPLADLSLILFVTTGSALAATRHEEPVAGARNAQENAATVAGFPAGVPSSIYVDAPSAPALSSWLARYSHDRGSQLTIHAYYAGDDRAAVSERADRLATEAIAEGTVPRVVVEQGLQSQVLAMFAHDRDPQMARTLLREAD